ncbi:MAG TPA: WD40 repeat domain-containing protein, partial [Kofleriaceae bacterium]|nr:WD40 repeat domain-containing protein [Kofleriaceae bacterium]
WDAENGARLVTLRGHAASVDQLAWSPDGAMLATASEDATVSLWDAATGKRLARRLGHGAAVRDVVFHPQGRAIASASVDRSAIVWSAEPSLRVTSLPRHQQAVLSARFSPSGAHVATAGAEGTVKVSDAATGRELLSLRHGAVVTLVRFSGDGRWIATAGGDRVVRVWDARTGAPVQELAGHRGEIRSLEWDPSGDRLITAGDAGEVRIWRTGRDEVVVLSPHGTGSVAWAGFVSPSSVLSIDGEQGTAVLSQLPGARPVRSFADPVWRRSATLDHRRRRAASPTANRTVDIWRLDTGARELELVGHVGDVAQVGWSPDDRFLVTGSLDGTARIWDATTGELLAVLDHLDNWILDATFSPDGTRVLTAQGDGHAMIWELPRYAGTAEQLARLYRCRVPYRLDGERLVLRARDPSACAPAGQNH